MACWSGGLELFRHADVDGFFVFTFAMANFPRCGDPEHGLDRAGFGIVAVPKSTPTPGYLRMHSMLSHARVPPGSTDMPDVNTVRWR